MGFIFHFLLFFIIYKLFVFFLLLKGERDFCYLLLFIIYVLLLFT
jgi:hypothetical protein